VIVCASLSSVTAKSFLVRPVTDWPFLSVTTTSTVTTSTCVGKVALAAAGTSGEAAGAGEGAGVWAAAMVQAARANRAIRSKVFFMTNLGFLAQARVKVHLDRAGWVRFDSPPP
jgi:hypothetical protein